MRWQELQNPQEFIAGSSESFITQFKGTKGIPSGTLQVAGSKRTQGQMYGPVSHPHRETQMPLRGCVIRWRELRLRCGGRLTIGRRRERKRKQEASRQRTSQSERRTRMARGHRGQRVKSISQRGRESRVGVRHRDIRPLTSAESSRL